ncbi:PREDICTED: protein FAM83C-like, partial [Tinamus guttatus]|uniref:protein FAM83C-like n=1 Tax=Tinamus guttatus TaxID=94827 RepID=UPI00052F31B6
FTWLCSQVHTSLATHFRGQIVADFDKEFRYLYAESKAMTNFCVPDPGGQPSSQNTSMDGEFLLKAAQANDTETSSPSSSLSNTSIRSIKMSPFLKNSTCNIQHERQDLSPDHASTKGKEDTSPKPPCSKQQGEPPDSPHSLPNKSTPAGQHKSTLYSLPRQEQNLQSPSESANSNGTSENQKGLTVTSRDLTAGSDNNVFGMEKRQSPAQGKLDLLSPYNQLKREKKGVIPCYDKLSEEMLMEKNSVYGAEKRMTLGHSKLDLITKYNKLKSKHIHSRFEL